MRSLIGSACSGIGGLERGLEKAGLGETVWQIERDAWCRKILERNWPKAERFTDVTEAREYSPVRVFCAGFPCQPVSLAGARLGKDDHRWLWPHVARIVDQVRPAVCVFENVLGLRTCGLRDVLASLASLGYDAEWCTVSCAEAGAPHLRERLFIVATDTNGVRIHEQPGWLQRSIIGQRSPVTRDALEALFAADADCERETGHVQRQEPDASRPAQECPPPHADSLWRLESARRFSNLRGWPEHCGWALGPAPFVDDGVPAGLVRGDFEAARKALGNAVNVRCSEMVGVAIREAVSFVP